MNPLRIQAIMHVPFEGPGHIARWARDHGHVLSFTRLFAGEHVPCPADYDCLLVMGGPMGVNDEDTYPWLKAEKNALREAIDADKHVLGICLGAQLIACVLGAGVHANAQKEIGWFPISKTPEALACPLFAHMPDTLHVLHWHADTYALPPGARHLFRSEACEHQGFALGQRVFGFQFHFETTPQGLEDLVHNGRHALRPESGIQSEQELLTGLLHLDEMHKALEHFLEKIWGNPAHQA